MGADENREYGKLFESVFERMARYSGLLPLKNPLAARFIGKDRLKLIKTDLDFRLITRQGRTGFFDCKTFIKPYFDYSRIDSSQLERAILYNFWMVPSGFVVWFRTINDIRFYSGAMLDAIGPGNRIKPEMGVPLGKLETLQLGRLFSEPLLEPQQLAKP